MDTLPSDLLGLVGRQLAASQSVILRHLDVEKHGHPKKAIETRNWKWILEYIKNGKPHDQALYEKVYAKSCQLGDLRLMTIFESKIEDKKKIEGIRFKYLAKGGHIDLIDQVIKKKPSKYILAHLGFIYEGLVISNQLEVITSRKYSRKFDNAGQRAYIKPQGLWYKIGKHYRGEIFEFIRDHEPRIDMCPSLYCYGKAKHGNPISEQSFEACIDNDLLDDKVINNKLFECIGKNSQYHGLCEQKIATNHTFAKPFITGLLLGSWHQKLRSLLESYPDLMLIVLEVSIDLDDVVVFTEYFTDKHFDHCIDYCISLKCVGRIFKTIQSIDELILRRVANRQFFEYLIDTNQLDMFVKHFDGQKYQLSDAILDASKRHSPSILEWLFDNYQITVLEQKKDHYDLRPVCDPEIARILVAQIQKGLKIVDFKKWIESADFYDYDDVVAILKTAL